MSLKPRIKKLMVFDRDGVLVDDGGYTHRLESLIILPDVIEGITLLKSLGFRFAIATGQSGIGKGMYTEAQMHAFNDALLEQLSRHDISIEAIAFCPHDNKKEKCECRKPGIAMLQDVETKLGPIDWSTAWGIGDKPADALMI
ncbi:MAG: HAD-IIIA family hydrolase [Patescibacteria group bacterium]